MADFNITVDGLDETIALLEKAPKNVVARGFLKAAQAGANVITDVLEPLIPVKAEDTGGILDKGEMKELLMIAVDLDSDFRGVSADVGFDKRAGNAPLWVEYGHRMVGHDKKQIGEVPAHPFMRPAADASAEGAIEAFTDSLNNTLREEYPQTQTA